MKSLQERYPHAEFRETGDPAVTYKDGDVDHKYVIVQKIAIAGLAVAQTEVEAEFWRQFDERLGNSRTVFVRVYPTLDYYFDFETDEQYIKMYGRFGFVRRES